MSEHSDSTSTATLVSRRRLRYKRARAETAQRLDILLRLLSASTDDVKNREWLKSRWRAAIVNMIDSGLPAGSWFHLSQALILFGGFAVPVLASFNAANPTPPAFIRYLVLIVSLIVALATALQQAFRVRESYEVNWRTAGAIEAEAWAFLHSVDAPYKDLDPKERWSEFVRRVEHKLVDWNERSISDPSIAAAPPPPPPAATNDAPAKS